MSFVGPRPLLPIDQPAASMSRLSVSPESPAARKSMVVDAMGAQEKGALDDPHIQNASF
jgi:hypothetical protein